MSSRPEKRLNESDEEYKSRLNSWELGQAQMENGMAMTEDARKINVGCAEALGKQRIYWYSIFGGVGLGVMLLFATFNILALGIVLFIVGVALGIVCGWAIHKFTSITNEQCTENAKLKYGGALLAFIPWIIAGFIAPKQ